MDLDKFVVVLHSWLDFPFQIIKDHKSSKTAVVYEFSIFSYQQKNHSVQDFGDLINHRS